MQAIDPSIPPTASRRLGQALQSLAVAILLLCVVGRLFITEMPFRMPALDISQALAGNAALNVEELTRVGFALAMLSAAAIWFLAEAFQGRLLIRRPTMAGLIVLFGVWALVSAQDAADRRSAYLVCVEQGAMLSAAWLAAQVFVDGRRFRMLVVVLVAAGGALAMKGVYQVALENPETLATFLADKQAGRVADSVHSRLLEARLRDAAPFGYFSLTNVYGAALLILMAASAALAADRIVAARKLRGQLPPGQVPIPIVQAFVGVMVVAVGGAAMVLTKSTGAIVSAGAAISLAIVVGACRKRLARHWKKALLAAGVLTVIAVATVVAYGRAHDRLPTRTMTFRWYYWTASAEIVRERPALGVGGGNFPDAYLRHRRVEAEEAVKLPHNAAVHAAAQFGLIGGGIYVGILIYCLIGACRPGGATPKGEPLAWLLRPPTMAALAAATVIALRVTACGAGANWAMVLIEAIMPAALVAGGVLLLGMGWRDAEGIPAGVRIALACGAAGFVLHNMVSVGLWTPATATLFWVIIGACLAQADCKEPKTFRRLTSLPWNLLLAAVIGVTFSMGLTIHRKVRAWDRMRPLLEAQSADQVLGDLSGAAVSDLLDPMSFLQAGRYCLHRGMAVADENRIGFLTCATEYANLGLAIWPDDGRLHQLAGRAWVRLHSTHLRSGAEQAAAHFSQAIAADPANARLRVDYAGALMAVDRTDEALAALDVAEATNERLEAGSLFRFSAAERERIAELRRQAESTD
ncbi:MAG: O-antigen ligase family protein [Planctomycetota bacterium]|jgi:hypothetical protein